MIMDGTQIKLGDPVFCVMRGAGKIISIQGSKFVTASFGGRTFNYNKKLAWVKGNNRSLYWHDPIITPPPKSSNAWELTKAIANNMLDVFNSYGVE